MTNQLVCLLIFFLTYYELVGVYSKNIHLTYTCLRFASTSFVSPRIMNDINKHFRVNIGIDFHRELFNLLLIQFLVNSVFQSIFNQKRSKIGEIRHCTVNNRRLYSKNVIFNHDITLCCIFTVIANLQIKNIKIVCYIAIQICGLNMQKVA